MAVGCATTFKLLICAHNHTADESAGWEITGLVSRPQTSGNVKLIGTPTGNTGPPTWGDTAPLSSWTAVVSADTSNQYLKVTVTGEAAKTITWIARMTTAELAY